MIAYEREKHEVLLVEWFYKLQQDPVEYENLFAKPLRNLTTLLNWAANQAQLMIAYDTTLWAAAWVTPVLSGAEFGAWIRKDKRKSISQVAFIHQCYKKALEVFPVLIGITRQPHLHQLHLSLGYQLVGEIPHLFDGLPAMVYSLTKESYESRRKQKLWVKLSVEPIRPVAVRNGVEPVQGGQLDSGTAVVPNIVSPANRRRKRTDTDDQPKRRRLKAGRKHVNGIDAAGIGKIGLGADGLRPGTTGAVGPTE